MVNTIGLQSIVFNWELSMFSTIEGNQIGVPIGLRDSNQRIWSRAELLLRVPWLFLEISTRNGRHINRQLHFLLYWDQLVELASSSIFTIEQAILATPGHMNHTHQWKFEELVEAWICEEPDDPSQTAHLYVVSSGAEYSDSNIETPPADLIRKNRVFPVSDVHV